MKNGMRKIRRVLSANQIQNALRRELPPDESLTQRLSAFVFLVLSYVGISFLVLLIDEDMASLSEAAFWGAVIWSAFFVVGLAFGPFIAENDEDGTWAAVTMGLVLSTKTLLGIGQKSGPRVPSLAVPILTLMANAPPQPWSPAQLQESLASNGVSVTRKNFRPSLDWLKEQAWIQGDDQTGYHCDPGELAALAKNSVT